MSADTAGSGSASPDPAPEREVPILDLPTSRLRRPADLMNLLASLAGIAVVLILSVFARSTTTGFTHDVQSALATVVRGLLLVPVSVIQGLLAVGLPALVIIVQVYRRNLRGIAEALIASATALILAVGAAWTIEYFASDTDVARTVVREGLSWSDTISPIVASLSGLLTAVGSRARRRLVAYSWNLLWVTVGVSIITGDSTLAGALMAVLIGRVAGLSMRYASGVRSSRADGAALVQAIRETGVQPLAVVRIGHATEAAPLQTQTTTVPGSSRHLTGAGGSAGITRGKRRATDTSAMAQLPGASSATVASEHPGQNRMYAVIGDDGQRWDAVVLDADRQVIGALSSIWSTLRLRGLERRTVVSVRQAAERAALMSYAATAAGVHSPRLRGVAEAGDSVLLLGEHLDGARSMRELPAEHVTHEVMVRVWNQLLVAHEAGLAHRNLSANTVLVAGEQPGDAASGNEQDADGAGHDAGAVWLNGWENGEVAASALAQRVDRAQLLAAFALHAGVDSALAAAREVLGPARLAEIAPLLQPVAFPSLTRAAARADRSSMAALRTALLEFLPGGGEVEPIRLARFSARTVITLTVAVAAVWILLTTMNFEQVRQVVLQADPLWMVAAFGLGLVSYLGAALGLIAFSPERLGLWRAILVQVAASVLSLVAPAGVAPAALNVRFMQRRGISTSLALATVALLQLSQFVTTVLFVVVLALVLQSFGPLEQLPSLAVVITLAVVAAVAGALLLIPPIRSWLARRALPTWRQVWPRVVWVLGQPQRLALGVAGALLLTLGFVAAFAAVLQALGQAVPLTSLTIVYLTGNTVGSAVPTPGGIGAVELALSAGLRTTGLATAAAASAAVLFRVLTFWVRIPLGWLAWRYLQSREAL